MKNFCDDFTGKTVARQEIDDLGNGYIYFTDGIMVQVDASELVEPYSLTSSEDN